MHFFWVVAFYFPFASYYSDDMLHRLSNIAVGGCLFFPIAFLFVVVITCWRNKKTLAIHKWNVIIPLIAVVVDLFLVSKV